MTSDIMVIDLSKGLFTYYVITEGGFGNDNTLNLHVIL